MYELTEEQKQLLIKYLIQKPYLEVANLVQINSTLKKKPDSEKKSNLPKP